MAGSQWSLLLDVWDPKRGGLEFYAEELVKALSARAFEIEIVCGRNKAAANSKIPLRELGEDGPSFYEAVDRLHAAGDLGKSLAFRHPGSRADVFLPLGGLLVSSLAARRAAEPWFLRSFKRLARKASAKTRVFLAREAEFLQAHGKLVLASSHLVAGEIRERFPQFEAQHQGHLEITGLPIDEQRFLLPSEDERRLARDGIPGVNADSVLVLWVGNDPRRKGIDQVLAVQQNLCARKLDAHLVLAGHGTKPYANLARKIHGLGHLPDIRQLYHAADVLLLPSLEDNLAFAVLEALATGLPVVTTARNGAAELLASATAGRAVRDPRDTLALDAACLAMLEKGALDPALRLSRRACVESAFQKAHYDSIARVLREHAEA